MGTAGLVPAWTPFSDGEQIVYRGLAQKIFFESKKGVPHEPDDKLNWVSINPEYLKRVYDDMVTEAGVKILFFSQLAGVEMKDAQNVDAVLVSNKAGLIAYQAKVYVDCTGDGDLSVWAGAKFTKGDVNGELMPATHCFVLSNVDSYNYKYGVNLHADNKNSPMWEVVRSGKFPLIKDAHMCQNFIGPDTIGFNAGHLWNVDNTNPDSISDAMLVGRKLVNQIHQALREYDSSAFAQSFLAASGFVMGIRETRIIEGNYKLSMQDWIERKTFDDEIGRNFYFIDIHHAQRELEKINQAGFFNTLSHSYGKGESHGIPYRCLVPKGLNNVLMAGRCISTDRIVQGSTRIMAACLVTGEAAGMAAAMTSKKTDKNTNSLDVQQLRNRLKEMGQYLK